MLCNPRQHFWADLVAITKSENKIASHYGKEFCENRIAV